MKNEATPAQNQRLNHDQIVQQAESMVIGFAGLDQNDAIAILAAGIHIITTGETPSKDIHGNVLPQLNENLRRRDTKGSVIENDPDMRTFIHSIDRYLTIEEMHALLVEKFGTKRGLTKSCISRYLIKIGMGKGKK